YQRKEPGIIDSQLLTQLVFDQGPKDHAGVLAKEEGIDFEDVTHLRISFKNILQIANLWNFSNLVKLQLDNNSISKIEGLDHMIHLRWLDLSFNVITQIDNLNQLKNLRDLTLYHNQITTLENMDELKNLEVLSIGRNKLQNIENVIYLRNFKSLKSVNFSGNAFTSLNDYRSVVIVYLPQLQYIDYSAISSEQRNAAAATFENLITTLEAKDEVLQSELALMNKDNERLAHYKKSFVDAFSGESFADLLFQEDDDDSKLKLWWVIQNLFTEYPSIAL
ncbi:hypothetical protein HELRODRAFT_89102, partial [Helobdella robusta]|uniref:Dynein regulatory complex subunit 3 n=1 Tax=Helobdella robusta TaxID=6412 RepID=T1G785_HELRO